MSDERACSVGDCERSYHCKGMCRTHYRRNAKHGDPLKVGRKGPSPKGRLCEIPGCASKHYARGMCRKHDKRQQLYGSPFGKSVYVSGPRGNRSYHSMHESIRYWKGKASGYKCVECGATAYQWSYDHQDPEEVYEDIPDQRGNIRSIPWSKKFENYQPMCRSCHLKRDRRSA